MVIKTLKVYRIIKEMDIYEAIDGDGTIYPIENSNEIKELKEGNQVECETYEVNDLEWACRIVRH